MNDHLKQDLEQTVDELSACIARFKNDVPEYTTPHQARDINGRPILADLLAAKANALAALISIERGNQ